MNGTHSVVKLSLSEFFKKFQSSVSLRQSFESKKQNFDQVS